MVGFALVPTASQIRSQQMPEVKEYNQNIK